jgi:hypothetical protein
MGDGNEGDVGWGVGSGGVKSGGQGGEGGAGTQQVHQNLQTNDTSGNEMR